MNSIVKLFVILSAAIFTFADSDLVFARGGGSNFMNSPGYQRALKDSRERYRKQYTGQPHITEPAIYPGRKWRHRSTRFRH